MYQTLSWDILLFRLMHQTLRRTRASILIMASLPALVSSNTLLLSSSQLFAYLILSAQQSVTTLIVHGRATFGAPIPTSQIQTMIRDTDTALATSPDSDLAMVSQTAMSTSTVGIGVCLFGTSPSLRCLRLTNYTFDESTPMGTDVRCFVHYLETTGTLRRLHLDGVRFACREDVVTVAKTVASCTTLVSLRWTDVYGLDSLVDPVVVPFLLSGSAIAVHLDHMGAVPGITAPSDTIRRLCLRHMVVAPSGLDALGMMKLVSLTIHTCGFRLVESTSFLAWISSSGCTLKHLSLQNNGLSGNHVFCFLSMALGRNTSLHTLDLSDNFLTRLTFHLILFALPSTLTTLCVRRNMIRIAMDDLTHLMARVELRKPCLTHVDATGNCFFKPSGQLSATGIALVIGKLERS
jgi:hypothetical protein